MAGRYCELSHMHAARHCQPQLGSARPGQKRTKKLLAQCGDRLVCVHYRDDEARQRWLKTVELSVEERPWRPERTVSKGAVMIGVCVGFEEVSLQRQVKRVGGWWNPTRRVWELQRDQALKLGLQDRMENAKVSICRNC